MVERPFNSAISKVVKDEDFKYSFVAPDGHGPYYFFNNALTNDVILRGYGDHTGTWRFMPPEEFGIDQQLALMDGLGFELVYSIANREGKPSDTLYFIHEERDFSAYLVGVDDNSTITFYLYAKTRDKIVETVEWLKSKCPVRKVDLAQLDVPVAFWTQSNSAHQVANQRNRDLSSLRWSDVKINYTPKVQSELEQMLALRPPIEGGRLILWHGPPGTGKSSALRVFLHEWLAWCDVQYVVDPERFFGDSNYMSHVIMDATGNQFAWMDPDEMSDSQYMLEDMKLLTGDDRWRLLVVEDAEELITGDAKERTGQGMARLLNLADGLIGQGLKFMCLITTNVKVKDLHEAVARPGRTLANIEFTNFDMTHARTWAEAHDANHIIGGLDGPTVSLAKLYDLKREQSQIKTKEEVVRTGQYL